MKRGRRWGTWDALAMLLNGVFGLAAAAGAAGCGGCCCCDRRPEGRGGQQQEGHDGEPPLSWSHPGRPLRPRPPAAKRELGRIGFRNSINRSRLGKLSKRRDFVRDKWRGERERGEWVQRPTSPQLSNGSCSPSLNPQYLFFSPFSHSLGIRLN